MTTPVVEEKRGFEVGARFYDYVPISEWLNQDFVLARSLTRVGIDDLVSGKADYIAVQQALLAVAVWHANPEQAMDRIIQFVYTTKPLDIKEVGFEDDLAPDEEEDAGPPAEDASAPLNNSSESGEASSE